MSARRKPNVKSESMPAPTHITTHDDGKFVRTAIVAEGRDTGSLDVVNAAGERLCQINLSFLPATVERGGEETLIVDVIDVDQRYSARRVLAFSQTERKVLALPPGGRLASVDFRRG